MPEEVSQKTKDDAELMVKGLNLSRVDKLHNRRAKLRQLTPRNMAMVFNYRGHRV